MAAELGHCGFWERHASTGRLLINVVGEGNILEQGEAHALLFHFLQQQAGVEQLVNLVDAPVAQAVHVHVVFVLHDNHSLGIPPLLTGLTVVNCAVLAGITLNNPKGPYSHWPQLRNEVLQG